MRTPLCLLMLLCFAGCDATRDPRASARGPHLVQARAPKEAPKPKPPADCPAACKNVNSVCPLGAVTVCNYCATVSERDRQCFAEAKDCAQVDACRRASGTSGGEAEAKGARLINVDVKQVAGRCAKESLPGAAVGSACLSARECQHYCCGCGESGWPSFAAGACIDGRCADRATACVEGAKSNKVCRGGD